MIGRCSLGWVVLGLLGAVAAHSHGHDHTRPGHEGHERWHAWLGLFALTFMIGAQIGVFWWKKRYPSSFLRVSLAVLWAVPAALSLYSGYVRFIVIWLAFSVITGLVISMSSKKPLAKDTPRRVYRFFLWTCQGCYGMATLGYVMVLLELFFLPTTWLAYTGIMLCFYGLYLGVLTRDCAEVCAERMASTMGYAKKGDDLPKEAATASTCGVCRQSLTDADSFTLGCDHRFHEECIRGWTIVGKKDICAFCGEKVNLSHLRTNPWNTQTVAWSQLLDVVRYLVAWNPLIMLTVQAVLMVLDRPNAE